MNNQTVACIVCGTEAELYLTKDSAQYFECPQCHLIFQSPLPTIEDMKDYADEEYADGLYKAYVDAGDLKRAMFRKRMPLIERFAAGKRLLDVGCSCGYFIDVALEEGFDAQGVEFSETAIAAASPAARPRIIHGDVNQVAQMGQEPFDVITAFDIIEHTQDPLAFLVQLRQLLNPQGLLVVTTPDTGHFLKTIMRDRWPMLQPFQHTFLFSKKSLQQALEKAGFSGITVTSAHKVLTPEYLAEQVRIYNPLFTKSYRTISKVLPYSLRTLPVSVNIGEIMGLAKKQD